MKDESLSKAYLDTQIILHLLLKDDTDIEREIKSVLTRKNNRTKYVVSLFVYGEVLNRLFEEKDYEQLVIDFKRILTMHKITVCGIPKKAFKKFAETCSKLCTEDYELDPTDTMIFSAAFIDEEANRVHFLEEKMLTSRVVLEMAEQKRGFKICPLNENSQRTAGGRK